MGIRCLSLNGSFGFLNDVAKRCILYKNIWSSLKLHAFIWMVIHVEVLTEHTSQIWGLETESTDYIIVERNNT